MLTVYTIQYNRPDFIWYQLKSLTKFLTEPFKLVVVNNGPDPTYQKLIQAECIALQVEHHIVTNARHDQAGLSHQRALEFTLQNFIYQGTGNVAILDFDIFLLRPYSVTDCLAGYDSAGLRQGSDEVSYIWPGCILLNLDALPNKQTLDFRGAFIHRTDPHQFYLPDPLTGFTMEQYPELIKTYLPMDSGSLFHKYRLENPSVTTKWLSCDFVQDHMTTEYIPSQFLSRYENSMKYWVIGDAWYHLAQGSNWILAPQDKYSAKIQLMKDIIDYLVGADV